MPKIYENRRVNKNSDSFSRNINQPQLSITKWRQEINDPENIMNESKVKKLYGPRNKKSTVRTVVAF